MRSRSTRSSRLRSWPTFQPRGAVADKYGVYLGDLGIANRGTFVIDKNGKIAHTVVTSIGEARDTAEYLAALENCPA